MHCAHSKNGNQSTVSVGNRHRLVDRGRPGDGSTLASLPQWQDHGTGRCGLRHSAVDMGITIGKVIAFIAIMMLVGRRRVPWIMARSAVTGSREPFTRRCWRRR
ncbi:hypothetical protein ACLK17_02730 [Escherichia coli]